MPVYNFITQTALSRALLEARSVVGLNSNPFLFPQFRVAAFKADGTVGLADATNAAMQKIAGISAYTTPSGSLGYFVNDGILEGALSHLTAAAGDKIYLGLVSGTLVSSPPSGAGVAQISVGYAVRNPHTGLISDLRIEFVVSASTGGGSATDPVLRCQNGSASPLQSGSAIAWNASNQVVLADPANFNSSDSLGILIESTLPSAYGDVRYSGIVPDVCTTLGAVAGNPVFLSLTPGELTTNPSSNPLHSIVRMGYAVPKSGTTGPVTDLLLDVAIIFAPV